MRKKAPLTISVPIELIDRIESARQFMRGRGLSFKVSAAAAEGIETAVKAIEGMMLHEEIVEIPFTVSELWAIASDLQRAEEDERKEGWHQGIRRSSAKQKTMNALKRITEEKTKEQDK